MDTSKQATRHVSAAGLSRVRYVVVHGFSTEADFRGYPRCRINSRVRLDGCYLRSLLARLVVSAFLHRLFARPGRLAAATARSRRIGQIDEAARHPAHVFEQLVTFLPDSLPISLNLAPSSLRLLPQRGKLFL